MTKQKKTIIRSKWPVQWVVPKNTGLPGVKPEYGPCYAQADLDNLLSEVDQTYFGGRCVELGCSIEVNVPRRKKFTLGTRRIWFATYNSKRKSVVVQPYVTSRKFPVEMLKVMDKAMDEIQYSSEYMRYRREFLDWACVAYAPEIKRK